MDSTNLAIIFAPTIFRPDMIDPMKAVMEMKLSKTIIKELIDRRSVLQQAMHIHTDRRRATGEDSEVFIFENPIMASYESALDEELGAKLNLSDVRNITDNFGSRLANRMNLTPRSRQDLKFRPLPEPVDPRESLTELDVQPPAPGESEADSTTAVSGEKA